MQLYLDASRDSCLIPIIFIYVTVNCFCKSCMPNMGHIIWLFDNKSEQFCMLPSMIQNISFNTFPSDGGWRKQNSFQNFIAGGCGGVSATLVGHPFDTIKVMTQ